MSAASAPFTTRAGGKFPRGVVTVHAPPTVTAGGTATFTGGGSPVTLDGTLSVSDADSGGQLAGATVSISSGFISGDTLIFCNQDGINGSYNSDTGVLTLCGTASLCDYQTALDSITYSFTAGGDPTGGGSDTARTINWVVDDGVASITATSTLDTVHAAPTVTAGGTATFTGGGSPVTLDGTLTVSDADSGGQLAGATVSISSGFLTGDTLNFTNQNGITGSYNSATGVLTLSGTASARAVSDRARLHHLQLHRRRRPDRRRHRHQPHHQLEVNDGSACSSTPPPAHSTTVHAAADRDRQAAPRPSPAAVRRSRSMAR